MHNENTFLRAWFTMLLLGCVVVLCILNMAQALDAHHAPSAQTSSWTVSVEGWDRDGRDITLHVPGGSLQKATSVGVYKDMPYTAAVTMLGGKKIGERKGHVRSGWQVTGTAAGSDHVHVVLSQSKLQHMDHVKTAAGQTVDLPRVRTQKTSFQLAHGQSRTVDGVKISTHP